MAEQQGASLKPSEHVAGGLADDFIGIWTEVGFVQWDYNGKIAVPVPALKVVVDSEDEGVITQYWSVGSGKDWIPSTDGKRLVAVGTATGLRSSSNGAILLQSLVNAGFPEDKIGDDISVFQGLVAHHIRVPAPKRAGLEKVARVDATGKAYEDTILTVDEIVTLPWEKAKPAGAPQTKKAAPKAKGAAPAPATVGQVVAPVPPPADIEDEATTFILSLLEEKGSITKQQLPTEAFRALTSNPNRNAIIAVVYKDAFLGAGPWSYADGTITPLG